MQNVGIILIKFYVIHSTRNKKLKRLNKVRYIVIAQNLLLKKMFKLNKNLQVFLIMKT